MAKKTQDLKKAIRGALKNDGNLSKDELKIIAQEYPGFKSNRLSGIINKIAGKRGATVSVDKPKRTIKNQQIQRYLDLYKKGGITRKELTNIFNKVGFKNPEKFLARIEKFDKESVVNPNAPDKFLSTIKDKLGDGKPGDDKPGDDKPGSGDPDYDLEGILDGIFDEFFGDVEGEGEKGSDFAGYKGRAGEIGAAAEEALATALGQRAAPAELQGAREIKDEFKIGRDERKQKIKKTEADVKELKPDFEDYTSKVKAIRSGTSEESKHGYFGKFQNFGSKLGIGYGKPERRARTEERFGSLKAGLRSSYETSKDSRQRRRELGNQVIQSLKMN